MIIVKKLPVCIYS